MNNDQNDLVDFRLAKANEAFELAKLAIENDFWSSAASELYYSCFYCLTALFAKNGIRTHTHSGVKATVATLFIKEGKLEAKWGKFFANLLDKRQKGDYGDFVILTSEEILPLVKEVEEFREVILKLINQ
jgi:uncharacterized protein (UPF0332 family)